LRRFRSFFWVKWKVQHTKRNAEQRLCDRPDEFSLGTRRAASSRSEARPPTAHNRCSGCIECNLLFAANRLPVAAFATGISRVGHGLSLTSDAGRTRACGHAVKKRSTNGFKRRLARIYVRPLSSWIVSWSRRRSAEASGASTSTNESRAANVTFWSIRSECLSPVGWNRPTCPLYVEQSAYSVLCDQCFQAFVSSWPMPDIRVASWPVSSCSKMVGNS
jgi:hypothetical protein